MGTGYTRADVSNNIADGNIINASDLDSEFDAVQAAFDAATGHTHDGTTAEGAPIEVTGPAQEYVSTNTEFRPKANNTYDLGSAANQWKDLYVDGTANLDAVDIDGGNIDGTTIGAATPAAGTFTTATATTGNITTVNATTVDTTNIEVTNIKAKDGTAAGSIADATGVVTLASSVLTTTDINGGTIDGATIGGASAAAGTFTTATATTGNITTVNATTVDSTNVEVTNIKAKDGTASATIADSTGVMTIASSVLTTADINGGTIDGTVIGGSTPAAISGTTGSFSGDVSIADKIVHTGDTDTAIRFPSNDTVVFETGGVERMRIDSGGSVGIGTNAPDSRLHVVSGSVNGLRIGFGGVASNYYDADTHFFRSGAGSEHVRITSAGSVGIGTSSPAAPLHVVGNIYNQSGTIFTDAVTSYGGTSLALNGGSTLTALTAGSERMRIDASGNVGIGTSSPLTILDIKNAANEHVVVSGNPVYGNNAIVGINDTGSEVGLGIAGSPIEFYTAGTERMRIDSSGNVGIGVVPSSIGTGWSALQIGGNGLLFGDKAAGASKALYLTQNSYHDGTDNKYISTDEASRYRQTSGAHIWEYAASGTAGNTISFSEAMRIDSSGNIGLGTSTGIDAPLTFAGSVGKKISLYSGSDYSIGIESSELRFATSGFMSFYRSGYSGSESMRLDSSGNLLVGTTTVTLSAVANFYKTATATNQRIASFINDATPGTYSPAGLIINYPNAAGGNGSTFLQCSDGTTDRLYILGSGDVQNTNNSYGAISDAKLKENITDATPKLDKLNQVRVVNFNLIGDEKKQIGVIAQELEQIFPSMVEETPDLDKEGNDLGTTTKSVKYSVFVPMLIKAMQEQQAIIEALEARVAALEA